MNIKFMSSKPVLNFTKHYKHNIWKVHAFSESHLIAIEVRDVVNQIARFELYDIRENKIINTIQPEEDWWINVSQITDTIIIFYTYEAENNPVPKEYLAYNTENGQLLWKKENADGESFSSTPKEDQNIDIKLPFQYQGGSEYFKTVSEYLKKTIDAKAERDINYFENSNFIIISYYQGDKKLDNFLLVLSLSGKVLFNEKIGSFDKGITDQSFFLIDNKLIFVKDVSSIFIYDLIQ